VAHREKMPQSSIRNWSHIAAHLDVVVLVLLVGATIFKKA